MERAHPLPQMIQLRPRVQGAEDFHLQVHREIETTPQGNLVPCRSGNDSKVDEQIEESLSDVPGEACPQNLALSQAQIQDIFASIQDLKQVFATELEDIKEKLKDLTTKWEELRRRMQNADDMDDDPFLWTHVQTPDSVISSTTK
ncbi:benzoate 4-monooxygenase cytochrome P450 [Purpureocillium lavendulum]|uniref:Benzoate 4-monooxygenase cytochrome P450 n=1 Tax=Purpureocillium lavendulum TaxID=1247861 RepID=A0AB34FJA5_9HYPO|nr:benzoate 4-monooxygenase cytochrome P450 [Purpureocillium lavendulum]